MKIKSIGKIRRRISNLFRKRAIVLLYHRISEFKPDPQLLCVTPAHFAEHMEYLRRDCQTISLQELREAMGNGDIPHKAIVVTFDDGYADNLWNAKPILEHYNIPATVFVTSGYVGSNKETLSDELERCLLQQKSLPEMLTLTIKGKTYSWRLDNNLRDIDSWNVNRGSYPTLRHRCYHDLHKLLNPLHEENRRQVLDELIKSITCSVDETNERRILNTDELRKLSEDGLVEIGAHGVNHLVLARQTRDVQWKEISESKQYLEGILKKSVTSFSYPYGAVEHVSKETVELVQEAGFELACANVAKPVIARSNLFWLPRVIIRDCSGEEFAKNLKRAFYGW